MYLDLIFDQQHSLHFQAEGKKKGYLPNTCSIVDPTGGNQVMT